MKTTAPPPPAPYSESNPAGEALCSRLVELQALHSWAVSARRDASFGDAGLTTRAETAEDRYEATFTAFCDRLRRLAFANVLLEQENAELRHKLLLIRETVAA